MREIRLSGSEGGGPNPIESPYPYLYLSPPGIKDGQRRGRSGAAKAIKSLPVRSA